MIESPAQDENSNFRFQNLGSRACGLRNVTSTIQLSESDVLVNGNNSLTMSSPNKISSENIVAQKVC